MKIRLTENRENLMSKKSESKASVDNQELPANPAREFVSLWQKIEELGDHPKKEILQRMANECDELVMRALVSESRARVLEAEVRVHEARKYMESQAGS